MSASKDLTKNLLRNASWLFSGSMATSLFALAEPILIARFLGVEQFGLFCLIISYVGIISRLIDLRSPEAVVRYVGQCRELGEKNKALSFIKFFYLLDLLVGVIAVGACLVLAGVANDLFIHSENAFKFTLVYSLSLLVSGINMSSEAVLRVFDRFKTTAFVRASRTGFRVVLVAACLIGGFGIGGILVCYVATAFVFFIVLQIIVSRVLEREGFRNWTTAKISDLRTDVSEVRSFVLTLTFSGFLNNILNRQSVPMLVLGYFAGKEAVGFYGVAASFSGVRGKLRIPINQTVYPALVTARSQGSQEDFSRIISYSTKNFLKIFLPLGLVFLLFADKIILILFGGAYQPATLAMRIIVISEVLSGFYFWIDSVEMALDKLRQRIIRVAVSSASYLIMLFMLVQPYSYEGAAASRLVPSILIFVFSLFVFNEIRRKDKTAI